MKHFNGNMRFDSSEFDFGFNVFFTSPKSKDAKSHNFQTNTQYKIRCNIEFLVY